MREPFETEVHGPILSRRFTIRLDDGWYLVRRSPGKYHATPIDGWRIWWWRFVTLTEATWHGFGSIRL